jgi:hypothetical protein
MPKDATPAESESSKRTEGFEVAFLPWLAWKRKIAVGPVISSPCELQNLGEPPVREYLSRYFPRYVEVDGSPIGILVLAEHAGVTGFRYHTDQERLALKRAADALAFSAITHAWMVRVAHDNDVPVPSSDSFQLMFQRFAAGSNFVGVTAGRAIHGWPLDEVMFTRPWAASAVFGRPDTHALEALGNLLVKPEGIAADFVERVWRSIEWFRLAHLDGADQTDEAKLVGIATAFESLFDLPEGGKQEEFAKRVESLVRDPDMGRDMRIRRSGKTLDLSLAGCWAWDFYELRSRLVHGDAVPLTVFNAASGIPHLAVADLVMRECLLRELFHYGCFGSDIRQAAEELNQHFAGIPQGPEPFDAVEYCLDWHLEFSRVHRVLGWSTPQTGSS